MIFLRLSLFFFGSSFFSTHIFASHYDAGYMMKIREENPAYVASFEKWFSLGPVKEYRATVLEQDKTWLLRFKDQESREQKKRIDLMVKKICCRQSVVFLKSIGSIKADEGKSYIQHIISLQNHKIGLSLHYKTLMNNIMHLASNIDVCDRHDKRLLIKMSSLKMFLMVCLDVKNQSIIKNVIGQTGINFLQACTMLQSKIDTFNNYSAVVKSHTDQFLNQNSHMTYPFTNNFFVMFLQKINAARQTRYIVGNNPVVEKVLSDLSVNFEAKLKLLLRNLPYDQKLTGRDKVNKLRMYLPVNQEPGLKCIYEKIHYTILSQEKIHNKQKVGFEVVDANIFARIQKILKKKNKSLERYKHIVQQEVLNEDADDCAVEKKTFLKITFQYLQNIMGDLKLKWQSLLSHLIYPYPR